jgi:NitT/TauT family transport system permease protein
MIFLQTVPIVAIAPLIIIWFGGGMTSIVVIVTVISLFPIVTNVTTGLRTVDTGLLDLMTLYRAAPHQVLFKVRLPNAIPYLITGAKVSSGLTIVGAVIGEYMAGHGIDEQGLGYYIFMSSQNFQTEILFASIFLSSLLGVTMVTAVAVISRTLLARWTFQLER